ncbi:MAG: hypothetical protein LAT63_16605 [Marinobacter sp.]|nr:hypothetical protein [Marinobacter sp.]
MEQTALYKKIPPSRFDLLAERQQFAPKILARLRRVLVDGDQVSDVAEAERVSAEAIRKQVRTFLAGTQTQDLYLTETQFNDLVQRYGEAFRPLSAQNVGRAKRVLVEREQIQSVADDAKIDSTTLAKVIRKLRSFAVPGGWRQVTVVLPDDLADQVEKMEQDARHRAGLN